MPLDPLICEQARLSRDRRFDGQFFVAVVTTGIFCRPVCPARMPASANVRFYPSAAAAQEQGFRPCLRCRPEAAPRVPEWMLGSDLALRGLRLIDAGFMDDSATPELAARLGVSARHLDRVFVAELGSTPDRLARSRRVLLAKQLLTETSLPMTAVALHAGFGSVRRFNAELRAAYGMPPSALRRSSAGRSNDLIQLRLPVRQPFCGAWVFDFLAQRSLPGVETVDGYQYRRHLPGGSGFTVRWNGTELVLEVAAGSSARATPACSELLPRVRRLFDLDADSETIDAALAREPRFRAQLARSPGLRVPGAWDGFEIAVRAILGQQVSVARARDLAVALCERFGDGLFPGPRQLADADVSAIGMPGKRGGAVRALARAVVDGSLVLDEHQNNEALVSALVALPGIGPWTAGYVAMRVGRDPDAWADADWVLLKQLQQTAAQARKTAKAWRPWRAYALMVLWANSAQWHPDTFPHATGARK